MTPRLIPRFAMFSKVCAGMLLAGAASAGELRVSADFEGGSARVESVDSAARVVRFMPGGDGERGWPCWWQLRVEGVSPGEKLTLDLAGSDSPSRNNGVNTGKPLDPRWAMPVRAAFSTDGKTWRHTEPGRREGARISYEVTGAGGPLWIAWGPPFTPRDTDEMIAACVKALPGAKAFELAKTRGGRPVRGLHVNLAEGAKPRGVWVQARQHAWESGGSWVAGGFAEWLVSGDEGARWLRAHAEIFVVPVMDADNAATGNGGKEANPRDHNRDWDDAPIYPEVAAAQRRLLGFAEEDRLDVFLDLHNPSAGDLRPFFFGGPRELLPEATRASRDRFLAAARGRISGPMQLMEEMRETGPKYHPLWRQISDVWVTSHGNPRTMAACLETSWNTPHSTTEGYLAVGRQLGLSVADFLRGAK